LASAWPATGPLREARAQARASSYSSSGSTTRSTRPICQRLVGTNLAAAQDQVLGPGRTDEARQPLGAATARDDAEQDLGLTEPGLGGSHPEVAGQCQLAAAAEGEARHRGDGGPRNGRDGVQRIEEQAADLPGLVGAGELRDVGAGREHPIAPGDHHGARRVSVSVVGHGPQLAEHLRRQGVHLGVGEADDGHAVGRRSTATRASEDSVIRRP
jgi:hypothetical protein